MAKLLSQIAAGLTIAALFRTAFEARDILETTRNQDTTLHNLKLRLDVEKCRLYLWGESMGLTNITTDDDDESGVQFPRAVRSILELLVRLFHSAERVKAKYADGEGVRITRTVTWLVHDRRRFAGLVDEIRLLVDRLREVTAPVVVVVGDGVDEAERRRLRGRVRETEALALVAGMCEVDCPDVVRLRRLGPLLYRDRLDGGFVGDGNGNENGNGNGFIRSTRYRYGNPRL